MFPHSKSQAESHNDRALPENLDRQYELAVRRLAEDLRFGYDASPFIGHGVDYAQSRPFVDGDSIKDIDWKLTARLGRYHVKEYEQVKCTPIYLLVDTSASMAISSQRFSKYSLAVLVAGGLGLASLRRLSPVGVIAAGDRDSQFEPSLSRARLFQWMHELRRVQFNETTKLSFKLNLMQQRKMSRSLIVVISDLHDPDAVQSLRRLAVKHDCVVIQVQDPMERGRVSAGLLRSQEAETGTRFTAKNRTAWFSDENRNLLIQQLKKSAIDHLTLCTDQPFVAPLRRFLADRGGLMRNTR